MIKKILQTLLWLLIAVAAAGVLLVCFLTVTEYKPAEVEQAPITGTPSGERLHAGEEVSLLSWNVGFAALGKDADFVLDGGGKAPRADRDTVLANLRGMQGVIERESPSLLLLQEADSNSSRSFKEDFRKYFALAQNTFALNYSCPFVPFPWPPFGRVNSGLLTGSEVDISFASRISLPCPFSWPTSAANLKRCLLVSYLPVEGSDKELVLINLHLEAYDSGEGKIAQTRQLKMLMQQEYEKGNYVFAAGDFNQLFPGTGEAYPNTHADLWEVGHLEDDSIPEGFSYVFDPSVPTCRLLNQPYDPSDTVNTQVYVIDGAIISPNITLREVKTLDEHFTFTDHNPVRFTFILQEEA